MNNNQATMAKMKDNFIDLTVTSPPYDNLRDYKGYSFNFEAIAKNLYRVTKDGGVMVWVVGDRINGGKSLTSFKQGLFFKEIGFQMHDVMIYQKKNTPFMRSNAYTNCYEFMFVLSKNKPKTFNPLKEKTVRSGYEMLTHNKKSDGLNKNDVLHVYRGGDFICDIVVTDVDTSKAAGVLELVQQSGPRIGDTVTSEL